jgi:hypothetical protein
MLIQNVSMKTLNRLRSSLQKNAPSKTQAGLHQQFYFLIWTFPSFPGAQAAEAIACRASSHGLLHALAGARNDGRRSKRTLPQKRW